jgi:hypothetical protein
MDPNSYSNCDQILTTHFHLELTVDFAKSSLVGTNTLNLTSLTDGVTQVILDIQGMDIQMVEQFDGKDKFVAATFTKQTVRYGSALIITLLARKYLVGKPMISSGKGCYDCSPSDLCDHQ